jgi:hypothetical protein
VQSAQDTTILDWKAVHAIQTLFARVQIAGDSSTIYCTLQEFGGVVSVEVSESQEFAS